MSNETLLDKALLNLTAAQSLLKVDTDDDAMINMVSYHLQQSAELFLKHFLETESTGFPFTRDITLLTDLVIDAKTSATLTDDFKMMTASFTEWEAKTRYVKNYIASRRMVLKAIDVLQKMYLENGLKINVIDVNRDNHDLKNADLPFVRYQKI